MSTELEKKRKTTLQSSKVDLLPIVENESHKHPRWNSGIRSELAKRKVNELLTSMKDGSPIVIYSGDTLITALGTMTTDKISSVPVLDKENKQKCVGFVDMMDVLAATMALLESGPASEYFKNLSAKEIETQKPASKKEQLQKASEEDDENTTLELLEQMVIESISAQSITDYSTMDTFCSVPDELSMLFAAEELAKATQQRISVVDKDKNFQGVISQSGFMEWISEEFTSFLKKEHRRRVQDVKLNSKFLTISPDMPAYEVFKKMKDERVNTLAICSASGSLLDVVSATDLMLWTEWKANGEIFRFSVFSALKNPISKYLEDSRAQREVTKRSPVTCTTASHVDDVITDMLFNNVHRVFVLDESNMPIGILTYGDLISDLIRKE